LNLALILSPLDQSFKPVIAQNVPRRRAQKPLDPITYEQDVYQHGLHYERPPFTFDSTKWEELAMARMSAESTGMSMARLEQV